jgi:hypothetical protein
VITYYCTIAEFGDDLARQAVPANKDSAELYNVLKSLPSHLTTRQWHCSCYQCKNCTCHRSMQRNRKRMEEVEEEVVMAMVINGERVLVFD